MEEVVGSIPTRSTISLNNLDGASAYRSEFCVMVCVKTRRFGALGVNPRGETVLNDTCAIAIGFGEWASSTDRGTGILASRFLGQRVSSQASLSWLFSRRERDWRVRGPSGWASRS
jgi:hypothetical protein